MQAIFKATALALALSYLAQAAFAGSLRVNPLEMGMLSLFLPVMALVLLLDLATHGWRASALRRLTVAPSASALNDLGYVLMNASGLSRVVGIVAFAGAGVWMERHVTSGMGLDIAAGWPLWVAVPALALWSSLWSYWEHRFWHSRAMWPLHQCHHAAEEFNVLASERAHPIEGALGDMVSLFAAASLGISPQAIALLAGVQAVASALQHSNLTGLAFLERVGVMGPAGHRVHHAIDPRLHHCNFGDLLNLWDRLFGTYVPPPANIASLPIGLAAAGPGFNSANPAREVVVQARAWLAHFLLMFQSTATGAGSQPSTRSLR